MSTDDQSSPTEPHAPQSRGMRAVLRRFRRGLKADNHGHGEAPPSGPGTGVDIVDQAEAFKTLRVQPTADAGVVKNRGNIWIWYTDDERHLPVQMRARLFWGTITFRLTGNENK